MHITLVKYIRNSKLNIFKEIEGHLKEYQWVTNPDYSKAILVLLDRVAKKKPPKQRRYAKGSR